MKETVSEASALSLNEIRRCIEAPLISKVPVYPALPNASITGLPTEDNVPGEGCTTFDILFAALFPATLPRKLLVDIEAQKNYHPGYSIVTRGVFHGSRLISRQRETEFVHSQFDDIQKVYSIWLCFDSPQKDANTITKYSFHSADLHGIFRGNARFDLISVVMIRLRSDKHAFSGDTLVPSGNELIDLLQIVFAHTLSPTRKLELLEERFGIIPTEDLNKEVTEMCNLSDLVEERGIKKGRKEGRKEGIEIGRKSGTKKGMLSLASAIERLKQGATAEDLLSEGIDPEAIKLAQKCLA